MVLEVTHKELKELLNVYYEEKISFFVQGRFGIGKSEVMKEVAKEKAKQKGKEFVEWNMLTEGEKLALMDNPEKKFVFIDIRLSEYSPDDIKGLPLFMNNQRAIEFKMPLWALLLENKDSDGFLDFEEINLATPLVMSSCYKIVYDRCVNQSRINPNWFIVMCGNVAEDNAYTSDIAPPLLDRVGSVTLKVPNKEDWIEWAIKNNINPAIIGYLSFKYGDIWVVDYDDKQKFTTPRGWNRLSRLIREIKPKDYEKLLLVGSSAIGEGVMSRFCAFMKLGDKLNIHELIKNPKILEDITKEKDLGLMYFIVTALADNYRQDVVKFKDIMNITEVLDRLGFVEFLSLLWRLCLSYNPKFEDEFTKGDTLKLANKYVKYL